MKTRKKRSFTLIELLIVVSIIAVLAAMLLPALRKARSLAHTALCTSNLRQIVMQETAYTQDYHDYYHAWFVNTILPGTTNISPSGWSQFLWALGYLPEPGRINSVWHCKGNPLKKNEYYNKAGYPVIQRTSHYNNYAANSVFMPSGGGIKSASIRSPGRKVIFADGLQRYNNYDLVEGVISQSFDKSKFTLTCTWGRFTFPHNGNQNFAFVAGNVGTLSRAAVLNRNAMAGIDTVL